MSGSDAELITVILQSLNPCLSALREHASKWMDETCKIDVSGALCIRHTPNIAPQAFLFRLFPQANRSWLSASRNASIPNSYRAVLGIMNGCFAYGQNFTLYGLAPSMQELVPQIDRQILQPLDIGLANRSWKAGYRLYDSELFHFGSRYYSAQENAGFFLCRDGRILSTLTSGEIIGTWEAFERFLEHELAAAAVGIQ